MRKIDKLIIHCADTREDNLVTTKNEDMDIGAVEIESWHQQRADAGEPWSRFKDDNGSERFIGYHYVIRRNGDIEVGRPTSLAGCHCKGHNSSSIAVCWVGRHRLTKAQKESMLKLCKSITDTYGLDIKQVFGHGELDGRKTCPNFNLDTTYKNMDAFRSELETFILQGEPLWKF